MQANSKYWVLTFINSGRIEVNMGLEQRITEQAGREEVIEVPSKLKLSDPETYAQLLALQARQKAVAAESLRTEVLATLYDVPGFERAAAEAIMRGKSIARVELHDGKILEAWGGTHTSDGGYNRFDDSGDPHRITETGETHLFRIGTYINLRFPNGLEIYPVSSLHVQTEQWTFSGNPARNHDIGTYSTSGAIGNSGPDYARRMTEVQTLAAARTLLHQIREYSANPKPT